MEKKTPGTVTNLLLSWRSGDEDALNKLLPLVEKQLHDLAGRSMRSERKGHTLQTTALVNEAYLRLVDADVDWRDRAHFFALTSRLMRRILVDHARARRASKRGDDAVKVTLEEARIAAAHQTPLDVIDLDEALTRLSREEERVAEVVELKYFGGLSAKEISEVVGVPDKRVYKDLAFAKAWLRRELGQRNRPGA